MNPFVWFVVISVGLLFLEKIYAILDEQRRPESVQAVSAPKQPEPRTWLNTPLAELDPKGVLTRRTGRFNPRFNMTPATAREIQLARSGR